MATSSLKLLIDTKTQRVLFAEAGKDAVNFLLTLLSLPVGKLIKLLSKDDMAGSLGNLYESIEDLSPTYMQPDFKDILRKFKEPVEPNTLGLLTNAQSNSNAIIMYTCSASCESTMHRNYGMRHNNETGLYITDDPTAVCPSCSGRMRLRTIYVAPRNAEKETLGLRGFVKVEEVVTYMIMDDLKVKPMSTMSSVSVFHRFKVGLGDLEEKVVPLGMDEGVKLLKASLESNSVLTKIFLGN